MDTLILIAAVVLFLRYSKAKQTSVEAAERKRQLLRKYKAASSEDLGKVLERRLELEAAVRSVIDAHPYVLCRFVPNDENEIIQEPIPDFMQVSIPPNFPTVAPQPAP